MNVKITLNEGELEKLRKLASKLGDLSRQRKSATHDNKLGIDVEHLLAIQADIFKEELNLDDLLGRARQVAQRWR